jgi:NAD(P)H-dependent FMN reductase
VHGGRERQERIVANTVQLMGLGGSLRAASTSRTALEVALKATTAAGAHARLVWVRDLIKDEKELLAAGNQAHSYALWVIPPTT